MRDYLLVLLAVFGITTIFVPESSATPDLDTSSTTQTVATMTLDELNKYDEISLESIADIAEITPKATAITSRQTTKSTLSSSTPSLPTYRVSIHSDTIVEHPNYSNIYKTNKLVYAHNSSNLFGNLKTFSIGTTFNLIENGVTTTYQVSDIKIFEKNPETGKLQLNGAGDYMSTVVKNAFYHNVALMTCTGTSYGNGDASHRLVIFADKI